MRYLIATVIQSFNLLSFTIITTEAAKVGHQFSKLHAAFLIMNFCLSFYLCTCSGTKRLAQVGIYRFCVGISALVSYHIKTSLKLLLAENGKGSHPKFQELISVDFGGYLVVRGLTELVVHKSRIDAGFSCSWQL